MKLDRRSKDFLAIASLLAFVAFIHHRVVLFGEQPVGGDKTAFFYGLMSHYSQCLKGGEFPFWNIAWGFGFPGVAESQIGAFYLPHWFIFRLMEPIDAFRLNYILHHFAVALAAYAGFRWMRLRPLGAWAAAMAYAGGGFATVHFDHQWAVESMTWLPPIVAAIFRWKLDRSRLALLTAPLFIAVQLTIGHFQVAFMTLCIAGLVACFPMTLCKGQHDGIKNWFGSVLGFALAAAIGFCLAGPQIAMTFEFQAHIRAANPQALSRDYLGNFALPADRLLNLMWPMLYFREPLWREIAWDPFKTSPEECLNYVGLAPLFFGLASLRLLRRSRAAALGWVLLTFSTLLALGPYTPLFSVLSALPGFGYFRAPARWTLGQEFALAYLAGLFIDRWARHGLGRSSPGSSRFLRLGWRPAFSIVAWLATGFALTAGWLRTMQGDAAAIQCIRRIAASEMPHGWPSPLDRLAEMTRTPRSWSPMTLRQWLALDRPDQPMSWASVAGQFSDLEMAPTFLVGASAIFAWLFVRRRRRAWLCAFLTIDLAVFGWIFMDRSCPREKLEPPSRFLNGGFGFRTLGPGGNFLMSVGHWPVRAYRTLDVPWPPQFFPMLDRIESLQPDAVKNAGELPQSLFGIHNVVSQFEPEPQQSLPSSQYWFADEQLDWWLDGNTGSRRFLDKRAAARPNVGRTGVGVATLPAVPLPVAVLSSKCIQSRGNVLWRESLLGLTAPTIAPAFGGLYDRSLAIVGKAQPISLSTHRRAFSVECTEAAVVVVGELFLPGWSATIQSDSAAVATTAAVGSCDFYWQAVELPGPGRWTVEFSYSPPGLRFGLAAACGGLVAWLGTALFAARRRRSSSTRSPRR